MSGMGHLRCAASALCPSTPARSASRMSKVRPASVSATSAVRTDAPVERAARLPPPTRLDGEAGDHGVAAAREAEVARADAGGL